MTRCGSCARECTLPVICQHCGGSSVRIVGCCPIIPAPKLAAGLHVAAGDCHELP